MACWNFLIDGRSYQGKEEGHFWWDPNIFILHCEFFYLQCLYILEIVVRKFNKERGNNLIKKGIWVALTIIGHSNTLTPITTSPSTRITKIFPRSSRLGFQGRECLWELFWCWYSWWFSEGVSYVGFSSFYLFG